MQGALISPPSSSTFIPITRVKSIGFNSITTSTIKNHRQRPQQFRFSVNCRNIDMAAAAPSSVGTAPKWAQKTVIIPAQRRGCHLVTSKVPPILFELLLVLKQGFFFIYEKFVVEYEMNCMDYAESDFIENRSMNLVRDQNLLIGIFMDINYELLKPTEIATVLCLFNLYLFKNVLSSFEEANLYN